jgi:hypothetical protein
MTENPKLPVWRTIAHSFALLLANWRLTLRVGWVAVLVTIALDLLFDLPFGFGELSLPWQAFIGYLEMLAYIPAIAAAVVPWHRFILLNEQPTGARLGSQGRSYIRRITLLYSLSWAATWLIYLSSLMFVGHPATDNLPVSLFAILVSYIHFAGFLAAYAGFVLLTPILPAAAVDRYQGVKRAFDLSRGNRLRLIAINYAVFLPAYVILWGIMGLAGEAFDGRAAYLRNAIYAVYFVFQALIAATALSLCYHRMGGMVDAAPPSAPET